MPVQRSLQAGALGTGNRLGRGDDFLAQLADFAFQAFQAVRLRSAARGIGFHERFITPEPAGQRIGLPQTCEADEGRTVIPQQASRLLKIGPILGLVFGLLVEKDVLLEAADFQGGIEKFGDVRAGDDLVADQAQFKESEHRQTDDQRSQRVISERDFLAQRMHGASMPAIVAVCNMCLAIATQQGGCRLTQI